MDDSSDGAFRLSGCLRPERCIVLERAGKREVLDKLTRQLRLVRVAACELTNKSDYRWCRLL